MNNDVIFKFNNSDGAVLCNRCATIVKQPAQYDNVAHCAHLCHSCLNHMMALEHAMASAMPIQTESNIGIDISIDDLWDLYVTKAETQK